MSNRDDRHLRDHYGMGDNGFESEREYNHAIRSGDLRPNGNGEYVDPLTGKVYDKTGRKTGHQENIW